jgi:hypothetical protein
LKARPLFHNYGIFWKKGDFDDVKAVKGRRPRKKEKSSTQFWGQNITGKRIIVDLKNQIGVYILFDKNKHVIYAGLAGRGKSSIYSRLYSHFKNDIDDRIEFYSWFGLKEHNETSYEYRIFTTKQKKESSPVKIFHLNKGPKAESFGIDKNTLIQHLEALLIEVLEPSRNKRGADWKKAERLKQFKSTHVTKDNILQELEKISKRIKELR